ncbi:thrombospondin type 3 repeat-containing protein [uncultured Tenacibaculum sp.]|uniref:thrombospondin type 3 repeat-containing protein n=1 Tax=uncultured Tenacibaculum sp. TaxID=174713 RepID=UPI00261B4990|nr:thrombospondin type 3 repeat-containing protein [uncultured Tenacibaculum sp.]
MNKKILFFSLLLVAMAGVVFKTLDKKESKIEKLRKQHAEFLKNHPYQKTGELPKKQRKAQGLPPNAYFEQKYLSEMSPITGTIHKENIYKLQEELKKLRLSQKVPGEAGNAWVERGPDNVGGRTRALLFDPNDATNETVFAGGVSGGLWKNTNISNPTSRWVRIGIPENLAVSCIVADPNNSKIFYVGTGESYTSDANGDGLWKTTDGGNSWNKVFGGATGGLITSAISGVKTIPGILHINDVAIRNNAGTSEIYVAAGEAGYSGGVSLGGDDYGLYKSTDGVNFAKVNVPKTSNGNEYEPNNIEISSDNSIYLSTNRSFTFGDGGGAVFKSTDGTTFTLKYTVPNGRRTEVATSPTNAGVVYVLGQTGNSDAPVKIFKTTNDFGEVTDLPLPDDADNGIPANDFTRGQAFYDLLIKVDPNDENVVYVGGIDLFKSTNGGASWNQISKWSNNPGLSSIVAPFVHADQHGIAFASSSRIVFSNDGGVYFSNNSGKDIDARNNNYNTLQFYTVGVAPTTAFGGAEYFLAGAQDNGSHLISNATAGINSSNQVFGGDGAASFFDTDGSDKYYIVNYVYNQAIELKNLANNETISINDEDTRNGDFINQEELDSNLNILYSNYTSSFGNIVRRYSNILTKGSIEKNNLTNFLMNSEPSSLKVSPFTTTSSKLYVGLKNGKLLKVEDANTDSSSWKDITGSNFVGSVSDIEFGENEDQILVTMHNYGVKNVWYTSDGGTNWSNKEGDLPDIPVKSILQNPLNRNEVIIGTDLGVWKTKNFNVVSPNWTQSYNGMSYVPVLDLDLRDDNTVFAATYGRGIFSGKFISDPNGDDDGDGVLNGVDNCPTTANADQKDTDGNGVGDACQDTDGDGVLDVDDNCPTTANADQKDSDGNGVGDACQDTDGDGVMDDKDNCIKVKNADQKDTNGNGVGDVCDTSYSAVDNISIQTTSETCVDQNDGKITVNVKETFVSYTVTLNGTGKNESKQLTTTSLTFSDLEPGSYEVCVKVNDKSYTQCFEINIVEASPVSLKVAKNNQSKNYTVNVNSGTAPYNVYLNGNLIETFNVPTFDVNVEGSGILEVKTSKSCEGVFKTSIDNIFLRNNPVTDAINLMVPSDSAPSLDVLVYDVTGKVVLDKKIEKQGNELSIPFDSFKSGIYILKIGTDKTNTFKILK